MLDCTRLSGLQRPAINKRFGNASAEQNGVLDFVVVTHLEADAAENSSIHPQTNQFDLVSRRTRRRVGPTEQEKFFRVRGNGRHGVISVEQTGRKTCLVGSDLARPF